MEVTLLHSVEKKSHKNCITSIGYFNGKIVTGGKDSTVILSQISQEGIKTLNKYSLLNENIVNCNVTSVDIEDDLIICGTNIGILNVIQADNITKIPVHASQVSCAKFLNRRRHLVTTTGYDNKVKVWDLRYTSTPIHHLIGHTAPVNHCDSLQFDDSDENIVQFTDNLERILTTANDRTARLWNVSFLYGRSEMQ